MNICLKQDPKYMAKLFSLEKAREKMYLHPIFKRLSCVLFSVEVHVSEYV